MVPGAPAARPHWGVAIFCSATSAAFRGNPPKLKGVTGQTPPVLSGAEAGKCGAAAEQGAEIFGGAAREAGQNVPCLANKI